jgi:Ricin-type beta-trefoil lectin domain-like
LRIPKLAALAASAAVALGAAAIVPAANAAVDAHTYRITTQGSLALDVSGGSHGDGAAVIQWPVNYGANQSWQVVNLPDGYQQLRNVNSGKCLTLGYPGGPGNAGTGITQWVCGSSANQEWSIDADNVNNWGNYLIYSNVPNAGAVDVPGGTGNWGTQLIIWPFSHGLNQNFHLTQVG